MNEVLLACEEAEKAEQEVIAIAARKITLEKPLEIKDLVIMGQYSFWGNLYDTGEYKKGDPTVPLKQ